MTLRATVNPENVPAKYQFSYGKTAAYGKAAPSTAGSLPPVSTPQQVSVHIGGLVPGTTYHYVLVADNSAGSSATTDTTFTTPAPPKVSTGSARRITPITATVAGTIIAGQAPTTACSFHFGRTKAYGSSVRCAWLPGAGASPVSVTVGLRGLRPGTLHHYRLRATSAGGTSLGHDKTLRTPPPDVEKLSVFPASFPVVHGGTTVSYTANAAMTTTFTILRRDRHGHYVSVGSFRHKGRLGRNSLRFSGRLRGRALAPGRYLLRARPRLRGVAGAARQVRFKIIV